MLLYDLLFQFKIALDWTGSVCRGLRAVSAVNVFLVMEKRLYPIAYHVLEGLCMRNNCQGIKLLAVLI